jgi:heptosyltransferase-1
VKIPGSSLTLIKGCAKSTMHWWGFKGGFRCGQSGAYSMRKGLLRVVSCGASHPVRTIAMESILLVKTSSLGDVIHNLPVVGDLHRARGGLTVDWVVEEAFAAIPRLHPGVARVIPVAIRRWRRALGRRSTWCEMKQFVGSLRATRYDAVIDTQGLLKSAMISAAARGTRYGLDWRSSREPLRPFYDRAFSIPWTLHAVERNRALTAHALRYDRAPEPDYGIRANAATFSWLPRQGHAVLLHATSAEKKLWPEASWVELGAYCRQQGLSCVLPWGSELERVRSTQLAAHVPGAVTPPALALDELAGLFAGAHAVVGVDTGLTHLAAALGVATVGIYCATDPAATGLYGCPRAVSLGGIGRQPAVAEVTAALGQLLGNRK